jgi:hypothetical protein
MFSRLPIRQKTTTKNNLNRRRQEVPSDDVEHPSATTLMTTTSRMAELQVVRNWDLTMRKKKARINL